MRHHGDVARLEVPEADLNRALNQRSEITAALRRTGYTYITLDLDGLRSGSLNEVLSARTR